MRSTDSTDSLIRFIGAAIGFGAVAALILVTRPTGLQGGAPAARLRVVASQDGTIAVAPAAPRTVLRSGPLRPGDRVTATLRLRNQTGERLAVGLRARPDSTALDGVARVSLRAGSHLLADGTLEALRAGSPGLLVLAPGTKTSIRVGVSIPGEIETGYEGANVKVVLEPIETRRP